MMNGGISPDDLFLFNQGTNFQAYRMFGAHLCYEKNKAGVWFSVWAPNASAVFVVGEWNDWRQSEDCRLVRIADSGVWTIFKPEFSCGYTYKYEIHGADGVIVQKSDPYAFGSELRPNTASVVQNLQNYFWQDEDWYRRLEHNRGQERPINIYEVHLGSWKRHADRNYYLFRELADELVEYVSYMEYTHIELMPLAEHPLDESWGYQTIGYYSVTSRFGSPQDFMYFVDCCHQKGIGVIMDWTPGQFCRDSHGLYRFDGTPLYEYSLAWRADIPEWGTASFDHGKPQVQSFLISNAMFWRDLFHIDGLRVDAVSNMLYLSYNKTAGDWTPNTYGGTENLESIAFLSKLNTVLHHYYPDMIIIAEDATLRPQLTTPVYSGGLGFDFKWNIGWIHDVLSYIKHDPIERCKYHGLMTFALTYAFSENYILPLSHDEVVHGKQSLIAKQHGDYWSKFANCRALLGYLMTMPGKKMLFMGDDIGQFIEWRFYDGLDWNLLDFEQHRKLNICIRDLNHLYKSNRCLWSVERSWNGFCWVDVNDLDGSTFSYRRYDDKGNYLLIVINFTPVVRYEYELEVPEWHGYCEIFNSDHEQYGGSDVRNYGVLHSDMHGWKKDTWQIKITLPPLSIVIFEKLNGQ